MRRVLTTDCACCFQERPVSSNGGGYIAADRLYDLNPMPAAMMSSSADLAAAAFGLSGRQAAVTASRTAEPSPVALLQYSAAYGNPYLQQRTGAAGTQPWPAPAPKLDAYGRPEPPPYSAVGRAKRKAPATAAGHHSNSNNNAAATANYHIGMAKRQTLATHV